MASDDDADDGEERRPIEPPSAAEMLQSAAQAATDLARVGVAIGREGLKAIAARLPKL